MGSLLIPRVADAEVVEVGLIVSFADGSALLFRHEGFYEMYENVQWCEANGQNIGIEVLRAPTKIVETAVSADAATVTPLLR